MKKQTIIQRIICITAAFVLGLFAVFESAFSIFVKAEETGVTEDGYTDVLDDLHKDETFDESKYPDVADDYSLQVIQIAESSASELFIYVYQPSHATKDLTATKIRMGLPETNVETTYDDYTLTLVSENGVFDKYVVDGFTVKTAAIRYYDIVQIVRPWESFDEDSGSENIVNTVACPVDQTWTVYSLNGSVVYSMEELDTIKVTSKYVGYLRDAGFYTNLPNYKRGYDSHFIAFSTDKPMDKILEVDIKFESQSSDVMYRDLSIGDEGLALFEKSKDHKITITSGDKVSVTDRFLWWKTTYNFYRISTVDYFIETNSRETMYMQGLIDVSEEHKMTEDGLADLKGKQWVIRFFESEYIYTFDDTTMTDGDSRTIVSNVTILRLKFDMDDDIYNLGVVDNEQSQSPDAAPDNEDPELKIDDDSLWYLFYILLILIVGCLLLSVLGFCLPFIKAIFKVLWQIITLPFKLIGKLFKKK